MAFSVDIFRCTLANHIGYREPVNDVDNDDDDVLVVLKVCSRKDPKSLVTAKVDYEDHECELHNVKMISYHASR